MNRNSQTYATGFVNPKTTLLFFDKLWLPSEIAERKIYQKKSGLSRFFLATDYGAKEYFIAEHSNIGYPCKTIASDNFLATDYRDKVYYETDYSNNEHPRYSIEANNIIYYTTHHRNSTIRKYVESIKDRFDVDVTAIYHKPTKFEQDYKINRRAPDFNSIQFCIDNVPEIDEELLDWDQVFAFRQDTVEVEKLQRFKLWFAADLSQKTEDEIVSTFEKNLDDYKRALNKHGILTSLGGFSTLITASSALFQLVEQGVFNQVIAGVSIAASLVYTVAEAHTSHTETRRNPIAYIYDISKKLSRK